MLDPPAPDRLIAVQSLTMFLQNVMSPVQNVRNIFDKAEFSKIERLNEP